MSYRLALWAALAGGLIPIMAVLNARLGRTLGHALYAPMFLFVMALSASVMVALSLRPISLNSNALSELNPMDLLGGLIVCFYVFSATLLAPRLGVGNFIMFAVVAQVLMAACIDHFGLFGVMVREISLTRLIGLLCLIFGLVVTQWSTKA